MTIKFTTANDRGFMRGNFVDGNGVKCSLQESSACRDEGLIWLGCNDANGQYCPRNGTGWHPLPLPECVTPFMDVIYNTRMHLTQSQVKELLPALQYFVEHGYLPNDTEV